MNFLVSSRMMAPVGVLSVLLLLLAFVSAWYVRNMQRSVSEVMMVNVHSMHAAQELEISIREVRTQFDRYLITLDERYLEPIPRLKERTSAALRDAESSAKTTTEQVLMQRARTGYENFFEQYETILRDREQWKYGKIITLIDSVLQTDILEPAHEYSRINEGMLAQTTEENRQLADRLTTGMLALGIFGSVAGLLGGAVIAMAIRRTIQTTETQVRSTAKQLGDAANVGRSPSESDLVSTSSDALTEMQISASAVLNRLRQTERDALRAEQLAWVGQMAAGIAHEIRNPLMSIKLLVQATAERGQHGFRQKDLQILEEEIIRLEQIVSGFLDFARPPKLMPQTIELNEVVKRTIDGVRARAELQGVQLQFQPALVPVKLQADPNQLKQVLFNLLFNALDAQPQGGQIEVRVDAFAPPGTGSNPLKPMYQVSVRDYGPGIPSEIGQSIFEPFISTKETGLGLGLSICRRIAQNHGGSLNYNSSEQGTTFTMLLPSQLAPS